jgi:hypothetical protein
LVRNTAVEDTEDGDQERVLKRDNGIGVAATGRSPIRGLEEVHPGTT